MKVHIGGKRLALAMAAAALMTVMPAMAATPAVNATPYTWQGIPFGGGGFVDGFVYHPKAANILYARTDIGGMYRYDFAAKSWVPLLDHLGREDADLMGVLSIALDPNDPDKVYAATGLYLGQWAHTAAVLRSNDRGRTWAKTDLSFRLGGNADGRGQGERLQVDPNNGQILVLGTNVDGVWKSQDAGKTFARLSTPFTATGLVLFDAASSQKGQPTPVLYVGSNDKDGGLYVSHDGGTSFALVPGSPKLAPQHAVMDASGALYVTFAGNPGHPVVNPSDAVTGGVWKLDPKSGKWTDISPEKTSGGSFGYSGIDLDAQTPGRMVVSTLDRWNGGDDIYLTQDGGAHWTGLRTQSVHDMSQWPWLQAYTHGNDAMGHWIADVKINPFNPDEMIYGTGYGLWMSENLRKAGTGEKVRFDFAETNFEETATLMLHSPQGGATVMAAFGDVGGAAWDDISKTPSTGLFVPVTENNYSIDSAALNPDIVVRSAASHGYVSATGGASWGMFPTSPYEPKDAQGKWHNPGHIAVSAKGTSFVWVPEKSAAFYTTDVGRTWKPSAGWPANRDLNPTAIADKAVDGVYYVYDQANGAILASADSGASFQPILTGIPKVENWQRATLAAVPGRVRDLWLAAPYGLLHLPSGNKPMANVKAVEAAWAVSFGMNAPDKNASGKTYPALYVYGQIKGKAGLYRSDDEGETWVRINDDQHQFGSIQGIAGDMLEYGTVYIAPGGRGVMVGRPAK